MFLKAKHWPVGTFAFHNIMAKRTLQIGTSHTNPTCTATFVLSFTWAVKINGLACAVYRVLACLDIKQFGPLAQGASRFEKLLVH